MRLSSILRIATLALSLTAVTGAMTAAFAADLSTAQQQTQNQTAPYDSQDFTVQSNNVNS